jgi:hypothetical protein
MTSSGLPDVGNRSVQDDDFSIIIGLQRFGMFLFRHCPTRLAVVSHVVNVNVVIEIELHVRWKGSGLE